MAERPDSALAHALTRKLAEAVADYLGGKPGEYHIAITARRHHDGTTDYSSHWSRLSGERFPAPPVILPGRPLLPEDQP